MSPYQFHNLNELQILDLSDNLLVNLTNKEFYGLNNLKELRLNNNRLSQLAGNSILELKNLIYLNAARNQLEYWDAMASFFNNMPNLEVLDLSQNFLDAEMKSALSSLRDQVSAETS